MKPPSSLNFSPLRFLSFQEAFGFSRGFDGALRRPHLPFTGRFWLICNVNHIGILHQLHELLFKNNNNNLWIVIWFTCNGSYGLLSNAPRKSWQVERQGDH